MDEVRALRGAGLRVVMVPWRLVGRAYVWLRPFGVVLVAEGLTRHDTALVVVQVMRALTR